MISIDMNKKPTIKFDELDIEILASPADLDLIKGGAKGGDPSLFEILQNFNFICITNNCGGQ